MKSVHIIVYGRVQGVFFRANARKKAIELGIKGYSKNMEDGTVEVVAQGDEESLDKFIDFIKKGPGLAKVDSVKIAQKNQENFKSFEITR